MVTFSNKVSNRGTIGNLMVLGLIVAGVIAIGINRCSQPAKPLETYSTSITAEKGGVPSLLDRMAAGDSVRIACFGNSITYGLIVGDPTPDWKAYPKDLQDRLRARFKHPGIDVLNCGTPGFTAQVAIVSVDTAVLDKQPDLCILMLGINDCLNGVHPEDYADQMKAVIHRLQDQNIEVLLLSPTPILRSENEDLQAFRQKVHQLAQSENCAFLDMHALIYQRASRESVQMTRLLPDEVHFAQDKYEFISGEIIVGLGFCGLGLELTQAQLIQNSHPTECQN